MDDYDSFEQTSSSSNNSNTEEKISETEKSSAAKASNTSASQATITPDPPLQISKNDAQIEAIPSDAVQEVTQHSFLTQGSMASSTESVQIYGAFSERSHAAINAVAQPKFQFLSNYKAFDSTSPSPVNASLTERSFASTPDHLVKEMCLSETKHSSLVKPSVTYSFAKNERRKGITKKDSTLREGSSSIFSTLSQHLKETKQTSEVTNTVPGAASVSHEAFPLTEDIERVIENDPHISDSSVHPAAIEPLVPKVKHAPPVGPSLPNLPPSSLSMKNTAEASAKPLSPSLTTSTGNMLISTTAPEAVPPLPPSRMIQLSPEAQAFAIDPKLLEMRETSEAVERLVKAFALLRGQFVEDVPTGLVSLPPSFHSSVKETLTSTAYHKVRGDATVRTIETKAPFESPHGMTSRLTSPSSVRHPPPLAHSLSGDEIAALKANEAKVEETLMVCVLEMLKRELSNPQRVQRLMHSLKPRPPHETITADEFKANSVGFASRIAVSTAGKANGTRHHDIYSVFDSDMRAFDGSDEDSALVLFNSIQDGIHKYVFHHVPDPMAMRSSTKKQRTVSPITPHFSWILLLDLLAVCEDIMAGGFAMSETASTGPLLVRYNGDPGCEFIARNAIQCLPFEALETVGGPERRKPVFRLEFWVTKDKMRVIMAAITDCVRQHIVHDARVRPYMALLENDLEVHPTVLVPSKGPLFSFVRPNTLGNGTHTTAEDDATLRRQCGSSYKDYMQRQGSIKYRNGVEDDESFFGVDQKALQKMAYAVSVISTDALASFTSSDAIKKKSASPSFRDTTDYEDLSKFVAETVCELLEDTAIKTSIERRARDKFLKMLKEKKEYPGKDSLEKERLVIERAEKEAEDMIKRIVQQMSLKSSER